MPEHPVLHRKNVSRTFAENAELGGHFVPKTACPASYAFKIIVKFLRVLHAETVDHQYPPRVRFGTTEYPVPGSNPVYVYLKGGNSFYAECPSFPDLESALNKNAFRNNFVKMMRSYAPEAYNKLQGKVRQMPSPEKLAQVKKPDSRVLFMGHKYAIFKGKLTWWEAEAYCESMGGHLATITSQAEQDFIDNHLNIDGARLWIGGYRPEGLGFAWITGEPWNYTNWDIGEPNNSSNVVAHEDSVCLWPRKWNDLSYRNTSEQNGFVCEWDK